MASTPTPLIVPESATDFSGLRNWLLKNVQDPAIAYHILSLIGYTFPIIVKIVLVRPTSLPYIADPTHIPGKQGRVDLLISDGSDADCLYQRIVLDTAFDFTNTREWVVTVNPLTPS